MGVQLNIKDPETVRLARELAGKTGRTVTQTIRAALEQEAASREAEVARKVRLIQEAVADFQSRLPDEWRGKTSKEVMDAIYDDDEPDGFAR